ncbi:MAG: 50S ribosomal protein L25 [SAR324 cluster bacterium]
METTPGAPAEPAERLREAQNQLSREAQSAQSTLSASIRTASGKGGAHRLRQAGKVPGIVYGIAKPVAIQCDKDAVERVVQASRRGLRLISLKLSDAHGEAEKHVLLKDVQITPVGQHVIHLDFQEIDVNKPVQISVPVHPVGTPEGIKAGGLLQTVTHEILVSCLPTRIPQRIEVPVERLGIGGSLHISDIVFPEGVRALTPPDETVFVITAPTAVAEEKAAAAAAAAAALAAEQAAIEAGVPLEGAAPAEEGAAPAPAGAQGAPAVAPAAQGAEKAPAKGAEKASARGGREAKKPPARDRK